MAVAILAQVAHSRPGRNQHHANDAAGRGLNMVVSKKEDAKKGKVGQNGSKTEGAKKGKVVKSGSHKGNVTGTNATTKKNTENVKKRQLAVVNTPRQVRSAAERSGGGHFDDHCRCSAPDWYDSIRSQRAGRCR